MASIYIVIQHKMKKLGQLTIFFVTTLQMWASGGHVVYGRPPVEIIRLSLLQIKN